MKKNRVLSTHLAGETRGNRVETDVETFFPTLSVWALIPLKIENELQNPAHVQPLALVLYVVHSVRPEDPILTPYRGQGPAVIL